MENNQNFMFFVVLFKINNKNKNKNKNKIIY